MRNFEIMMDHGLNGAGAKSQLRQGHQALELKRDDKTICSNDLIMIRIPKSIYNGMIEHARREAPLECCGILGGRDGFIHKAFELKNEEQSPIRYMMSPQEQLKVFEELEGMSMDMLAIYHSHTHTIAFPSETDVRLSFYPGVASIIISLKDEVPVIKAFKIEKEAIYLEDIEVIP